MVMNRDDYQKKIIKLLNPENYTTLPRDPTQSILRKTNQLIKGSSLPPIVKRDLLSSEALPPRLYGLPKVHKADIPLRPIVNSIGSPTYALSRHLADLLRPHI